MTSPPENVDAGDAGRPPEIEGITNRLFVHRVSQLLVPHLQKLGVHPNMVSLTGMILGLAAAPMYIYLPQPYGAFGVLLCLVLWLICDGADGKLARATGKASATGHIIDGIADYSIFVAYYTVMAFYAEPQRGTAILWITAAAGASHIIQAASYEAERERYILWTRPPADQSPQGSKTLAPPLPLSLLKGLYEWLQNRFRPKLPDREHVTLAPEFVSDAYRLHFERVVGRWGMLSANSHVVVIFLFALAGAPEGYFLFEVTVFNSAWIMLIVARNRAAQKFNLSLAESLQTAGEQEG